MAARICRNSFTARYPCADLKTESADFAHGGGSARLLLAHSAKHMLATVRVAEAIERLKGVFLEVPGTHLSTAQAARLSGLDEALCVSVLSALEDARFLKRTRDGRYRHRTADSPLF